MPLVATLPFDRDGSFLTIGRMVSRNLNFWSVLVWFMVAVLSPSGAPAQPKQNREVSPKRGSQLERALQLRADLSALKGRRPKSVPRGTLTSIEYLLDTADRIGGRSGTSGKANEWRGRAARYLAMAKEGRDPYAAERGTIVSRGYRSPISTVLQGYAVYVPKDYDPSRAYPLYIALHGGSSNGNLFLGVVLGNNMDWKTYIQHLHDEFKPRYTPDWIVVAPTGFGQVMWRWMGEQDVLDVIADVTHHYHVDSNQVVLGGLSNGGVGAYAVGMRHAWRFAAVQAMAGAPSWIQYVGGKLTPVEQVDLLRFSGMHLAKNSLATDFRSYHGRVDPGPMRPQFIQRYDKHVRGLGITPNITWYDTGHDILYLVHRHGRVYQQLADVRRNPRPASVHVVTGDYRAARQHWVTVTRIEDYPQLATVRATADRDRISVETDNVGAFALDLRDAPIGDGNVRIQVDRAAAYSGPSARLGDRVHVFKKNDAWKIGFPERAPDALAKRRGLSGPITDAYYDRMIHVYGTQNEEHTETLRKAAERGARGWPLWSWNLKQQVIADTEVTPRLAARAHLVLYGSPGDNAVIERIKGRLPIRVEADAIALGARRIEGADLGVRFIYPNPEAQERYVIVQAATTPAMVQSGNRLPEFLPDYAVYDRGSLPKAQKRTSHRYPLRESGFFDGAWKLQNLPTGGPDGGLIESNPPKAEGEGRDGGLEAAMDMLPVPPAPPLPPRPTRFLAPATDPAGRVARRIARRVPSFPNFRAHIPGAIWRTKRSAMWSIRPSAECMEELRREQVPVRPHPELPTPVATPVELMGPVDGVWFRSVHEEQPLVISCELAAKLPRMVAVLKRHGIEGVDVASSYRDKPRPSFHTMGLALDISRFWRRRGWLSVLKRFEPTPLAETCPMPRGRGSSRALHRLACDLYRSALFSSVLTPNYNEGHRDHLHIDARPDDPRLFVR